MRQKRKRGLSFVDGDANSLETPIASTSKIMKTSEDPMSLFQNKAMGNQPSHKANIVEENAISNLPGTILYKLCTIVIYLDLN